MGTAQRTTFCHTPAGNPGQDDLIRAEIPETLLLLPKDDRFKDNERCDCILLYPMIHDIEPVPAHPCGKENAATNPRPQRIKASFSSIRPRRHFFTSGERCLDHGKSAVNSERNQKQEEEDSQSGASGSVDIAMGYDTNAKNRPSSLSSVIATPWNERGRPSSRT
jgi:hypothetical protein